MTVDVRTTFLATGNVVVDLVESAAVGERWLEPSAIAGYSVWGLAAHLCRAISTPLGYLDHSTSGDGSPPTSAAEYFRNALGDHDPFDSDVHVAVRQRSDDMAASGWSNVLDATRAALQALVGRLQVEPQDRQLEVIGGTTMYLDDYLQTRIVEMAIHSDDLTASCDGLTADLPETAWAIARQVVSEVAALRSSDRELVVSLSRRERSGPRYAF